MKEKEKKKIKKRNKRNQERDIIGTGVKKKERQRKRKRRGGNEHRIPALLNSLCEKADINDNEDDNELAVSLLMIVRRIKEIVTVRQLI